MSSICERIKVTCCECGKIEYVTPSRARKYVCCSTKCMGKHNSKKYSKRVTLICPICGKSYECKQSKIKNHRTCGNKECRSKWISKTRCGENNANYKSVENILKLQHADGERHYKSRTFYQHVAKEVLGLNSICDLPKGYVIHHKDANHENNNVENLVMIPKSTHRLIHSIFGNIMINALHTGKIDRETFFRMCNEEQANFYKEIIDLNITHQVVVKQGELLESPEEDNQQPSIYRNIYEGSTTNELVLTDNAEDGNFDTSALPIINNNGDEIV